MGLPPRNPPRYRPSVQAPRNWTRADLPAGLDRALEAALDRGAKVPAILRLTEVAGYTDWGLLLSARSERQVRGIVDGITEALGGDPDNQLLGADGLDHYLWALLDYGDFLVHVFYHPVRRHYDLESMWSDAPRVELGLPAELFDETELLGLAVPDPMPAYRGDMAFGGFEDEFVDEPAGDDDEDEVDGDDDDDDFEDDDDDFEDDDFDDDTAEDGSTEPDADKPAAEPDKKPGDDDLFDP
jgi:ribosome silencing factor RsfS/YbeB/iojap